MKIESGIWNEVPFSIAIYLCDDFSTMMKNNLIY